MWSSILQQCRRAIGVFFVKIGKLNIVSDKSGGVISRSDSTLAGYTAAILMLATATLICELLFPMLLHVNLLMVYLVTVVVVSLYVGRYPALLVVVLSAFMHNYLYVPPRFKFDLQLKGYMATFLGLLATGTVISLLISRSKEKADELRLKQSVTASLYSLSRDLAVAADAGSVISAVISSIETTLQIKAALYLSDSGRLEAALKSQDFIVSEEDFKTVESSFEGGQQIEHYRPFFGTFCCFPVKTMNRSIGVLAVVLRSRDLFSKKQAKNLMKAFASQAGMALERVNLAMEAEQAERLRARQKLHKALLNSVSHDLRTPLSTITGVLCSLLDEGDRLPADIRRELLENARHEADRLNRFVGKLLDMSRLEGGGFDLKIEPCDIQDLIGTALGAMERQLEHRSIKIDLAEGLPMVNIDMPLMNQVLINLLDNANKYSPLHESIEITAVCDQNNVMVSVADRGPGVPDTELDRIFEKFYRVPEPEGVAGTGLGLSICRGIVDAHGAGIRAFNRACGGLEVVIYIPYGTSIAMKEENSPDA